jgi:glycosyl transferase family WbsX
VISRAGLDRSSAPTGRIVPSGKRPTGCERIVVQVNRRRRLSLLLGLALVAGSVAAVTHAQSRNDVIVIGQLNLWYYGAGPNGGFEAYDGSGRPVVRIQPRLGEYHSSDPGIARQQIDWAADNGVDAFSIEWISPRGEPGSIEDNLDDGFLKAPNLCRARWLIFYDFVLRLVWQKIDVSSGIDFDIPTIRQLFVSDMIHFADKYFAQPQYLKLDGRPVVYVYGTWNWRGDFAGAVAQARAALRQRGYDVFISAEEPRTDRFDPGHATVFDANASFIPFLIPGQRVPNDIADAATIADRSATLWQDEIRGLTVQGRSDPLVYQSAFTPQYDDTLYRNNNGIGDAKSIPARSKDDVVRLAQIALAHAQPEGASGDRIVWLSTFNNWAETTTVEPTADSGPKYPAGNYGFDMLDVVRDVFGAQTFGTGVTCGAASAPLPAPAHVRAVGRPDGIHVSWGGVRGAARYEVWRAPRRLATTTRTSYIDRLVQRGVRSRYWIVAISASRRSKPSASVTASRPRR